MGNQILKSKFDDHQKFDDKMQCIAEYDYQSLETKYYEGQIWDHFTQKFIIIKFQIQYIDNKEIRYIENGQILRIEQITNKQQAPEIIINLDQIKYLQWKGIYGNNMNKVGKWKAIWNGETLDNVTGWYSKIGEKQGLWMELIQKFSSQAQVYEKGEYCNNFRRGRWNYIYGNQQIGGGYYSQNLNQKIRKWVEISDNFWRNSQILQNGEYINGKKVGLWDIYWRLEENGPFKLIGCGLYDESQGLKNGLWYELSDKFWSNNQVIYYGEYKNNCKIGKWDILWRLNQYCEFIRIGGGSYKQVQGQKQGKWIELNDQFSNENQITFQGEYQNGMKIGHWETLFQNQQIGGGLFNEQNGLKKGKWIELDDNFQSISQVTYCGEYNNGKKFGKWKIFQNDLQKKKKDLIGGGQYFELKGFKTGLWIDIIENFCRWNILTI
ncbi:unnamed protein product [Paramecium sonneborni]|uniref:Uncharacterized protein n=1 Tax=Paramecium sonneborni TaxID=65129 RepID=A0A8S1R9L7_9CILI|nr:unnamed protein product [Paramecium sonneborni]